MPAEITKREAVRRALAAGRDKPKEGVAFIRKEFGIDIQPHAFSLNKVAIRKQLARKQQSERREGQRLTVGSSDDEDDAAALARAVKQLAERYGPEAVRRMLDVFAD